jgi:hypothetical protein
MKKTLLFMLLCLTTLVVASKAWAATADATWSYYEAWGTGTTTWATDGTKTKSLDIDGDGTKEKVKFTVKDASTKTEYAVKVTATLTKNGKTSTILSTKIKEEGFNIYIEYSKVGKGLFLIYGISDFSDYEGFCKAYSYDKTNKKLVSAGNVYGSGLGLYWESHTYNKTKGTVTFDYFARTALGDIDYKQTYTYKDGKLTAKKTGGKVKVATPEGGFTTNNNSYTISKTVKAYTTAGGKTVAFTLKDGDKVTATKALYYKGKQYLQFQYGEKTGWIRIDNLDKAFVYDVEGHSWNAG